MKIFNCDVCNALIFFENSQCLNCGSELGYIPELDCMSSIVHQQDHIYLAYAPSAANGLYKKCSNYHQENVCNWMISANDPDHQCISCRLNLQLPDLSIHENRVYWQRLEIAKRRLIYSILRLDLPLHSKQVDKASGLGFAFLRDDTWSSFKESKKVMTGHSEGLITINLSEANDAVREKVRIKMNERYRTLLGHFRHEVGHYYWSRFVEKNEPCLGEFRELFGDERLNYNRALNRYYREGPIANWQDSFVTAYASSHPWEDWAESWAHYLHIHDSLETANSWGISVERSKPNLFSTLQPADSLQSFETLLQHWIYLSMALNSLNRSMGKGDAYPFILSGPAIKKIAFIQKVIRANRQTKPE